MANAGSSAFNAGTKEPQNAGEPATAVNRQTQGELIAGKEAPHPAATAYPSAKVFPYAYPSAYGKAEGMSIKIECHNGVNEWWNCATRIKWRPAWPGMVRHRSLALR